MKQEALRSVAPVDASHAVELFTRQCVALISGDPTFGSPAITKALHRAEGQPLSLTDLQVATNELLVRKGRDPLNRTQLMESLGTLWELDLVRIGITLESGPEFSLSDTGSYMAKVLLSPVRKTP